MKTVSARLIGAALLFSVSLPLAAQQAITLDSAAITRLGLVFAAVTAADPHSGTRLPATVIASPDAAAALFAVHEGVLESWQVSAGQQVSAGTVLAVIRSPAVLELQQQWMAARSAEQQADIAAGRDRALFEQGIIAQQRLQDTERLAQQARFTRQALAASLEQLGYDASELAGLASGTNLGRYRVKAAVPGVVTTLAHRTGDMILAGEALLSLRGEELWLSAALPARLALRVEPGQTVAVADTETPLQVRQVGQAFDQQTQTAEMLAAFMGPVNLRPGQIVTLLLPPQAEGVLVPATGVVHNGADTVVYVRTPAGVEARTLVLQPHGGDYLAASGLVAGEQVAVRGAALLKGITLGLGGE